MIKTLMMVIRAVVTRGVIESILIKDMKSILRQMDKTIDLNIIYNELYANVNMKIVKHGDSSYKIVVK
jgi:hypothetical protein